MLIVKISDNLKMFKEQNTKLLPHQPWLQKPETENELKLQKTQIECSNYISLIHSHYWQVDELSVHGLSKHSAESRTPKSHTAQLMQPSTPHTRTHSSSQESTFPTSALPLFEPQCQNVFPPEMLKHFTFEIKSNREGHQKERN